jgi:hypothetical protein
MRRELTSFAFVLTVLLPTQVFAETGRWEVGAEDGGPIVIVGSTGGPLSGAYRVTNMGPGNVGLCLNTCTGACSAAKSRPEAEVEVKVKPRVLPKAKAKPDIEPANKDEMILRAGNSRDLFVTRCLRIQESVAVHGERKGASGTYENLSPVSAP